MDKVKAGVIGLGYFANAMHLPSLSRNSEIEIVAVADPNEASLRSTAGKYGFRRTYTDYREMLKRESLEVVYVIVSPKATLEVASATMEARIPTMLEKPPGVTSDETRKLIEVADRTGTLNIVAFNRRHCPPIRKARELFGSVKQRTVSAKMLRWHRFEPNFVEGTGIHSLDALRYLGGDVAEVYTVSGPATDGKGGTNIVSILQYESGAMGQITIQTACGMLYEGYEMHGEDMSVFITMPQGGYSDDPGRIEVWQGPMFPFKSFYTDIAEAHRPLGVLDGAFEEEMSLVRHMRAGTRSPNDVHDGLKTMLLAEAIAKGGKQKIGK
jgi:myo-inositol 2-dehydrogenase / D-chiro-inositol 1-dehydrogenase